MKASEARAKTLDAAMDKISNMIEINTSEGKSIYSYKFGWNLHSKNFVGVLETRLKSEGYDVELTGTDDSPYLVISW